MDAWQPVRRSLTDLLVEWPLADIQRFFAVGGGTPPTAVPPGLAARRWLVHACLRNAALQTGEHFPHICRRVLTAATAQGQRSLRATRRQRLQQKAGRVGRALREAGER